MVSVRLEYYKVPVNHLFQQKKQCLDFMLLTNVVCMHKLNSKKFFSQKELKLVQQHKHCFNFLSDVSQ